MCVHARVHVCLHAYKYMYGVMCSEVRGQLEGVGSFLRPWVSKTEFSLSGLVASAFAVPSLDFLSILSSACLVCLSIKQ